MYIYLFYYISLLFSKYFNYSLLSPQFSLTLAQRNIHHTHKVATPPRLKMNEKIKFKSTLSHFLCYTSATRNQKPVF